MLQGICRPIQGNFDGRGRSWRDPLRYTSLFMTVTADLAAKNCLKIIMVFLCSIIDIPPVTLTLIRLFHVNRPMPNKSGRSLSFRSKRIPIHSIFRTGQLLTMAAAKSTRSIDAPSKIKLMRQREGCRKTSLLACAYSNMCDVVVRVGIRIRETGQAHILSADASGFWALLTSHLVCYRTSSINGRKLSCQGSYYPIPRFITDRDLTWRRPEKVGLSLPRDNIVDKHFCR